MSLIQKQGVCSDLKACEEGERGLSNSQIDNRDLSERTKLLAGFEVRRSVRSECLLGGSESTKETCLKPISHLTSRLSLPTIPEFACDESIGLS